MANGSPFASVKLVLHDLLRSNGRCRWAPSARGTAVVGTEITLDPDEFTAGEESDAEQFAAGMAVRISNPGTATSVLRNVVSVVGNALTTLTACGLSAPVIVEFASWGAVTAAQRRWAYLSSTPRKRYS